MGKGNTFLEQSPNGTEAWIKRLRIIDSTTEKVTAYCLSPTSCNDVHRSPLHKDRNTSGNDETKDSLRHQPLHENKNWDILIPCKSMLVGRDGMCAPH